MTEIRDQRFPSANAGYDVTMTDHTKPTSATRTAEQAAAGVAHEADRPADDAEAKLADEHKLDPDVVAHEEEMLERGKNQKGEGRI